MSRLIPLAGSMGTMAAATTGEDKDRADERGYSLENAYRSSLVTMLCPPVVRSG